VVVLRVLEGPITAAEMDQWFSFAHPGAHHFADQNIVIARQETLMNAAFYGCEGARNQGNTCLARLPGKTVEPIRSAAGKSLRKFPLALPQNVDSKVLRPAESINHGHLVAQAN
jgi:hypothetical protein